jgi:hypothetical protein
MYCRVDRQLLTPGKLSPMRLVPAHIPRPPYADSGAFPPLERQPQIHNAEVGHQARQQEPSRSSCRLLLRIQQDPLPMTAIAVFYSSKGSQATAHTLFNRLKHVCSSRFPSDMIQPVVDLLLNGHPWTR